MAVLFDTKQTNKQTDRQTKTQAAAKQNLCMPACWILETGGHSTAQQTEDTADLAVRI
jgi:hypothetical protein